jgi:hypothetical protein
MALAKVYSRTRNDLATLASIGEPTRGFTLNGNQVEMVVCTKDTGDTSGSFDLTKVRRPNRVYFLPLDNSAGTEDIGAPATGTATIAGASGSVDGMEINGVEIMSGAEAFDTDSDTTAGNVASNITAHTSSPDYNASATGSVITVTATTTVENHEAVNGFTLVTSLTTMTSTDVNMANGRDPDIEEVTFTHTDDDTIAVSGLGTWTRGLLFVTGRSY